MTTLQVKVIQLHHHMSDLSIYHRVGLVPWINLHVGMTISQTISMHMSIHDWIHTVRCLFLEDLHLSEQKKENDKFNAYDGT